MHLFCYGTLQFPEVMQAVTGSHFATCPAELDDHACYTVRGRTFPGIIPEPGAVTRGLACSGIGTGYLRLLDRFEGDFYRRVSRQVRLSDGRYLSAWVYLVRTADRQVLTHEPWNREHFAHRHLQSFLQLVAD